MSQSGFSPREVLQPFEDNPRILQDPNQPDKLFYTELVVPKEGNPDFLKDVQALFDELSVAHGIKTAHPRFIQLDDGNAAAVVDRISGTRYTPEQGWTAPLKRANVLAAHRNIADETLDKQYRYVWEKGTTHEPFLTDIFGLRQHVFTHEGAILVDCDTLAGNYYKGPDIGDELYAAFSVVEHASEFYEKEREQLQDWRERAQAIIGHIFATNEIGLTANKQAELARLAVIAGVTEGDIELVAFENIVEDLAKPR